MHRSVTAPYPSGYVLAAGRLRPRRKPERKLFYTERVTYFARKVKHKKPEKCLFYWIFAISVLRKAKSVLQLIRHLHRHIHDAFSTRAWRRARPHREPLRLKTAPVAALGFLAQVRRMVTPVPPGAVL